MIGRDHGTISGVHGAIAEKVVRARMHVCLNVHMTSIDVYASLSVRLSRSFHPYLCQYNACVCVCLCVRCVGDTLTISCNMATDCDELLSLVHDEEQQEHGVVNAAWLFPDDCTRPWPVGLLLSCCSLAEGVTISEAPR